VPGETKNVKTGARERLAHEVRELATVFALLAPFFLSFEAYRMYLERQLADPLLDFGMALVNALLLSKIILLGEFAHLGTRARSRPLLVVTVHKAAVFTVFYGLFHLLERGIHGLLHGENFLKAVHAEVFTHGGGFAIRLACMFFAFMPFFALMESRQVIGEERFHQLFLGSKRVRASDGGAYVRLEPRRG